MKPESIIEDFARAICSAKSKDFPDIQYDYRRPGINSKTIKKSRRPESRDIQDIFAFYQTFGSTFGLMGGMGGAAMTTHLMVVVFCRGRFCVYQHGSFVFQGEDCQRIRDEVKDRHITSRNPELYISKVNGRPME